MNKVIRPIYSIVKRYSIISFAFVLILTGCSMPSVYQKQGMEMYQSGDFDKAVEYLEKAFKDKPNNNLKVLLFRARLNSYYYHVAEARKFKELDKKEDAVKEYKKALSIFPNNKTLNDEMEMYVTGKKEITPPFQTNIKPPVSLKVDPNEKMELKLRNHPITKIYSAVGKTYGVNFVFDKDFRDFNYTIDVASVGFYDILTQLNMVSAADYRILDKSTVLVFPDNAFKKRSLGLRGIKVFYLANIKAEDAKKMLMSVFKEQIQSVQEDTNLNTLIVKADYPSLVEAERFLNSVDKRKSEVMLDVQIIEMSKSLTQTLGLTYGDSKSALTTVSAGGIGTDDKLNSTMRFKDLKYASYVFNIPSAAINFLETDDKNRIIAKPNLRGVDGEEIKFMVGDEVPVPQTTFSPQAAGGVATTPVTSYQYKNVGVEVKITPYIHKGNEVTIKLKLTISSVTGYENGFPTFGKRELESIIRLKEGETNIVGGFLRDEMRNGLAGLPGLSKIPILGRLFGSSGRTIKQTDVIFSITPQVVRRVEIRSEDEETIWSNIQNNPGASTGGVGVPDTSVANGMMPGPQGEEPRPPSGDSISIMPSKRRVPVNSEQFFTIRVNSAAPLNTLAFSGSVSGGRAIIEEIKTDFFGDRKVQIMKNVSGSSYDLGYTFPEDRGGVSVVAQMKVKFYEKGNYTISISGVNATGRDRKNVDLIPTPAEVEIF